MPPVIDLAHDFWHMWPGWTGRYDRAMTLWRRQRGPNRGDEQIGLGAGIATVVAVGIGLFASQQSGQFDVSAGALTLAWAAYAGYLAVCIGEAIAKRSGRSWRPAAVVTLMVVFGIVLRLAVPAFDWTAVLFVVTAATAAFDLRVEVVSGIVALQTIVTAITATMTWEEMFPVVLVTTVYLTFQVFATVVVRMATRQAEARRALAAANAELAAATSLLAQSSRNTERLRIARELHDVVGHELTALALELEIAGHKEKGDGAHHVERARSLAKNLLSDIRQVVSELRDGPEEGLDEALRPLLAGLPGLAVHLYISEERPVDKTQALAVVRLVQEASTNTLRHAAANSLTVRVTSTDEGVSVDIRDDGVGATNWQPGNGLLGMRERITQCGGEVSFDAGSGQGFGVKAWMPAV